jgi:hypothetical protein
MAIVYVTQEQRKFNISPAMEFGEIKTLLPPGLEVYHSGGQVAERLKIALQHYSDEDYLLLIGDPVTIGITVAVAGWWNNGKVKLLRWDRQERKYIPVFIKLY